MRDCAKRVREHGVRQRTRRRSLCCLTLLLLLVPPVAMARFEVTEASTHLRNGVYQLNAAFELSLPQAPRDALASGVPLYLTIEMQVLRERNWWWDETVAALNQRYRLEFHALSGKYLAINLNTGVRRAFNSIDQCLAAVARLRDFPLLDRVLVSENWRYLGTVSVGLELGRLPLPLVPGAYFSSSWRLTSESYQWLLK